MAKSRKKSQEKGSEAEKEKRAPTPASWSEENPPPVSPGRPASPDAEALFKAELEKEPGISDKLAAIRVALHWTHNGPPKNHGLTKFYWELRERSSKEFKATWDDLEAERKAQIEPAPTVIPLPAIAPAAQFEPVRSESVSEDDAIEATEGDEELRASIVELLKKFEARRTT